MSKLEKSNPISLPLHVSHNANLSLETQRVEVEITGRGASLSPPPSKKKNPTVLAFYFTGKKGFTYQLHWTWNYVWLVMYKMYIRKKKL